MNIILLTTCNSDELKWTDELEPISVNKFSEHIGPTSPLPSKPIEIFRLFFTEKIVETIVYESNSYAKLCMGEEMFTKWDKITRQELEAYFGFMILMGLVPLPSYHDYWRKMNFFNTTQWQTEYHEISFLKYHVNNSTISSSYSENYDRLCKVHTILEYLCDKVQHLYDPHCECSIDKAMVPYKGHCSMKQYLPKKPTKRGLKVWMRADSTNGYVSEFQVYVEKEKGS